MSFSVATVKFSSDKTCFASLSSGVTYDTRDVLVYEIERFEDGQKVYVSWSGDTVKGGENDEQILQLNGIFAEKLGLKEGKQVVLREVKTVKSCIKVHVEPVTADDWEIFDRHASFIESRLMNQVRVIQTGMVYPIWVEKSNCVFIKIGAMTPDSDCCLLANETEVIVEPKVRASQIGPPVIEEPIEKSVTAIQESQYLSSVPPAFSEEEQFDPKFISEDSDFNVKENRLDFLDGNREDRKRERSPYDFINSGISGHWRTLASLLGFHQAGPSRVTLSDNDDDYDDDDFLLDEADHSAEKHSTVPNGLSFVLRIQPLEFNTRDSDHDSRQPEFRRGSHSPRKNGSSSPRKTSRESPSKFNRNMSNHSLSNFRLNYVPKQPSNVYVDKSDLEKLFKANRQDIPTVFIAKIRKLHSPKDEYRAANLKNSLKKDIKSEKDKTDTKVENDKISPCSTQSFDSTESPNSPLTPGKESEPFCVVRVIVIDRRRQLNNDMYSDVVKRILDEQPLLRGHVIIPDMIRRTLKLDKTSRVWIQTFTGSATLTDAFTLYPLGNPSKKIASDTLIQAFKRWLDYVSCEEYPLVVYQGIFLRFEYQTNSYIEVQLTYNEKSILLKSCYALLHPGVLRGAALSVVSGSRTTELTHPAVQPMLAYTSIDYIDPVVPKITVNMLGGMSDLMQLALSNIEICLGSRPLYKEVFLSTPGLLNGMLLLTGQKGSGKTTLVKALCNELSKLPNLAYTTIVDCKPLRGKKVDTIQKMFELQFDEAAWRQPSLLVFDNLDHIAGSPAGPEFEMSAEALYAGRVAEVLKDLLRKDIRNMTHVAVLATSQSRSSLHSILVSSRGAHLVQEVMTISPPDKAQREDILRKIMIENTTISKGSVNKLDLGYLSHKMQGFVARDLESVINRAIHAHILMQGRAMHRDLEIDINQEDFEVAISGFTPASIRNVPLHQAGELGWDDVGGLTDVKETLIETLQWPSKYPVLFSNCPLRLRSGLLLYGAPGTGKTLLAGVVAKECGLNFISIKGPELLSKYIGASEQAVRDTFVRAQSAKPCILFFDEFDSIAPRRGHDNTGVTDRVVNQLLTQLDGVEGLDGVYVLAATSRPDLIDPALLRPGRLDKCLQCQMPNQEERLKILKALSRKMNMGIDVDLKHFAESSEDFTGADFKALLYNAQLEAIHEFMAQTVSDPSSHQFGIKKSAAARFKNRAKKGLTTDTVRERRKSFSGTYAYIPSLEEGIVNINADIEEKLSTQVSQIRLRERRSSEHIPGDDKPDSPYLPTKLITVYHKHMLSAVSKMRPSVTGDEKMKYQRIYEKFLSAGEGSFNMGYMEAAEMMKNMRATLA